VTFTGCKVFTGTTAGARETLGDKFTAWLKQRPEVIVVETRVLQSSDNAYHALTICVFYNTKEKS
jgi:hypothetical protein